MKKKLEESIRVVITKEMKGRIEAYAEKRGVNLSIVIRWAVNDLLNRVESK